MNVSYLTSYLTFTFSTSPVHTSLDVSCFLARSIARDTDLLSEEIYNETSFFLQFPRMAVYGLWTSVIPMML